MIQDQPTTLLNQMFLKAASSKLYSFSSIQVIYLKQIPRAYFADDVAVLSVNKILKLILATYKYI